MVVLIPELWDPQLPARDHGWTITFTNGVTLDHMPQTRFCQSFAVLQHLVVCRLLQLTLSATKPGVG
jgi:hypothetical protein